MSSRTNSVSSRRRVTTLAVVGVGLVVGAMVLADRLTTVDHSIPASSDTVGAERAGRWIVPRDLPDELTPDNRCCDDKAPDDVPDDWIPREFNGMRYYIVPLASLGR